METVGNLPFMKTFILVCIFFVFKSSLAQESDKKYTFKEVGWTLTIPADFKVLDSTENALMVEQGLKVIGETNEMKAGPSKTRYLISATKNATNYFCSTITVFGSGKESNYKVFNQSVNDLLYNSFLGINPDAKIDTFSTEEKIDGLTFAKFHLTVSIDTSTLFNLFLVSKHYMGYALSISYLYSDDKTKEQIEAMLRNSKFTK
jgi:hypothetical protein